MLFVVHRTPYPPNKGDKLRSFWELQSLAKHSDVDLFGFFDDPADKSHLDRLHLYCRRSRLEQLSPLWGRCRALRALFTGKPFTPAFFYSKRLERQIQFALATNAYDAIVVFSSSMAQYVKSHPHELKILDLVDVDSAKWRLYARRSNWPLTWLWEREARLLADYEKQMVESFATTLVCTDAEGRLLRCHAPKGKVEVLQNFLDVDSYDPAKISIPNEIRSWQPYVVFSGSMDYFPNVDAARYFYREIFSVIRKKCPNLRFVIAGRNPHPSIVRMADDPGVRITGGVAEMKSYIAGAAVSVVPMRIARGVQNKILEALACGVAVVTTSGAALGLPKNLQELVRVADTPGLFVKEVIGILTRGPQISSWEIRLALKKHFLDLDLNRKLERLVTRHSERCQAETNLTTAIAD